MNSQSGDRVGSEGCSGVDGLAQGFSAMGTLGAIEPAVVQGFADQFEGVCSDGGLFFHASGVADADKETGQEQGGAHQGAAGVGGEGAGTLEIDSAIQILKHGEGPHGGVFGGRKGVVENGVRRRNGFPALTQPRGKIAEGKLPVDVERPIDEGSFLCTEQFV